MNAESDAREFLRRVRPFSNLAPAITDRIALRCRFKRWSAHQSIFREGDVCSDLYIMIDGKVRCYRTNEEGRELLIRTIECPGNTFCVTAAFGAGSHVVCSRTTAPTRAYMLNVSSVKTLTMAFPALAMTFLTIATGETSDIIDLAESLALKKVVARVATVLRQSALSVGKRIGGEIQLDRRRWRVEELASSVGTVRVHLARSLRQLALMGAIRIERKKIIVTDIGILDRIAAGGGGQSAQDLSAEGWRKLQ